MTKNLLLSSSMLFLFFFSAQAQNIKQAGNAILEQQYVDGVAPASSFIEAVDANAVYSNVTTYSGTWFLNGFAGLSGTNTITTFVGDSLGLSGAAPYSINKFRFTVRNSNTTSVTFRPIVYFYQNDGAGNSPGTLLAAYSFNPITISASSASIYTANIPTVPFAIPTGTTGIWMGQTFDNNNGALAITVAQLNNLGIAIFNPINVGSSTDEIVFTNSPDAPSAANPIFEGNFGGVPLANLGYEISKENSTLNNILRTDVNPHYFTGTISWSVNFTNGKGISGLTASNFNLALSGVTASITSVASVTDTTWTVTATLAGGTGTVGLNLVNTTGLNTGLTNALPFTGEVYTITNVLAIGIEYLRGSQNSTGNSLVWKVNSTDDATMWLERSADGINFNIINTVTATAVRCNSEFNYADNSPLSGINYYRLKTDQGNGHFAYSNIVKLSDKKEIFSLNNIQPNPATNYILLSISGAQKDKLEIVVYDMTGRKVLSQSAQLVAGSNAIGLDISRLAPGTYTVSAAATTGKAQTVSFIKK